MKTPPIILMMFILLVGIASAFSVTEWDALGECTNLTYNIPPYKETVTLSTALNAYVNTANVTLKGYLNSEVDKYNNNGINVTTYSGLWTVNSGTVTNLSHFNDQNLDTYTELKDNPHNGQFDINFSVSSDIIDANVSVLSEMIAGSSTVYCRDQNGSVAHVLGNLPGAVKTITTKAIDPRCFSSANSTIWITVVDAIGNAAAEALYEIWINYSGSPSYPTNVTLELNDSIEAYNNNTVFNGFDWVNVSSTSLNKVYSETPAASFVWYSTTPGVLEVCINNFEYSNVLNLTIRDEVTGLLISENLTVEIAKGASTDYYWTNTGLFQLINTFNGEYTAGIYNNNYPKRTYVLNFEDGESHILDVYMANTTRNVRFTVKNQVTGDNLEGALVSQYRSIGVEFVLLGSSLTDINGQVEFTYEEGIRYYFTVELAGYQFKDFYLDPIISDEYTVLLVPTGQGGSDNDLYNVIFNIQPDYFINNTQNNLTVQIRSPGGILTGYNITVDYPVGQEFKSGSNPTGAIFGIPFTITNALSNDKVNITIRYSNTVGDSREYRYSYAIGSPDVGTMFWFKRSGYGMGILERILIMIFLSVIVGGAVLAFSGGSMEAGLAVALLIQGITAYLLDINVLFIFPTMLGGIILIMRRSH